MAVCREMLPEYQLIDAIRSGCVADFEEAVSRGATIDARDFNGRGVLEVAMRRGRPQLARRMVQDGADPNGAIGKRGDHLIHLAARTADIGFLTVLLEAGVSANSVGSCRRTPLHMVTKRGCEFMAVQLLNENANPNASDQYGDTPLHVAATRGDEPIVKLLLKHGATATITNNQLYTPIHNAAAYGQTGIAKRMLEHEQSTNPKFERLNLPHRIQQVAERHGQHETAAAILAAMPSPVFEP